MKASTTQSPPANLKPSTSCEWGKKNSPSLRSKAFLPGYECRSSSVSQLCPTLRPHGLQSARLLCAWDSSGKNTGVGCRFLLPGIFPTQRSNLDLLRCKQILYHLSYRAMDSSCQFPSPSCHPARTQENFFLQRPFPRSSPNPPSRCAFLPPPRRLLLI